MVTDLSPSKFQPASRDVRNNIETQDNFAQAAFWSREYQLNPADLEAAIKLSAAVRKMGNPGKAVEIAQTSRAMYPRDPYLTAEYAAALIASERGAEAMEALDQGLRVAPGYARLWSLKGAALDQQENYDLARKHYGRALQITPRDPNVMSNLGLNYALSGDAATAETWMRRAASQPGAGENIRQNLDLIMQLQGKEASAPSYTQPQSTAQNLRATPPAAAPQAYGSQASLQPRTYGQAVARPKAVASQPAETQPAPGYSNYAQPQSSYSYNPQSMGHRSNVTVVGGQGQARSASDMARAAAAKSQGRGQKVVVPLGTEPQAKPVDILTRLSSNVGPRQAQQSAQMRPQQQPQNSYAYQPAPNYEYQQPVQTNPYVQPQTQPDLRRGAARRR